MGQYVCTVQSASFPAGKSPKKLVTATPQLMSKAFVSVSGSGLIPGYNIAGILIFLVVVLPCVVFVDVIVTDC